ncbi:MAG: NADH-ubiquinone oxidoreductase-F iron-sulfur binding region domain-containing protein [Bacteroidales bacterium]
MSRNLRGLSARKGLTESLYEEIAEAAGQADPSADERLLSVASGSMTGHAAVMGASSFYDFLRKDHIGKKAYVCDGTACLTSGKQAEVRSKLLKTYAAHEIGVVTCVGHCHSNDAFMVSGEICILDGDRTAPVISTMTNADKPALLVPTGDIKEYYSLAERWLSDTTSALREIELSGLRGRGGAGFPFHLKVKTSRDAKALRKYIVCNADEGDPGAYSDKWLLEERPHSVLFGMMMTGIITGADTGVVYIRSEYPLAVQKTLEAVRQLEEAGITEGPSCKATFPFRFHVVEGSGAYICGEETSLLNSLEGLRPEVRTRPPFPAVYGLFGMPTVLSNVETFANVHYILKEGGADYAALGTEKSPGTKLVSLDGAFNRPGLLEVRMGTPLRTVLDDMGGGTQYPVKAFQVGGPLGGLVPTSKIDDLTLDFESFAREGFLLGHAGIVSVPADFPVIKLLEHLFEFTRKESCGKCFPCRLGSVRGHELLSGAAEEGRKIDRQLFDDLLETMQIGSLCALGGGLPLPVKNALHWFSDELEGYFTEGGKK